MPRIYDGNSDPHDFCCRCFPPSEEEAFDEFGAGEGPDGRGNCFGYDAEHPPYGSREDARVAAGDPRAYCYRCEVCNEVLTDDDDA